MSSPAQILANQANAKESTGAKTRMGKLASSLNARVHGLSSTTYSQFIIRQDESEEEFRALKSNLIREHAPQTPTEKLLVRRMIEHEWLRARAVRLSERCCSLDDGKVFDQKAFALYLRYQTMHERGFYKALNELQKLRNERRKQEIGFVSQKRAAEAHEMKKAAFEFKKQRSVPVASEKTLPPNPETNPGDQEMAA
jgi:hypothetical protein